MSSHQFKLTTNTTLSGWLYADLRPDVDHIVKIDYNDHKGHSCFQRWPCVLQLASVQLFYSLPESLLSFILATTFPSWQRYIWRYNTRF